MEILFWSSVALVVYVYFGYPAIVWILARALGSRVQKESILPRVTVLTAAYNEEKCIADTVRNILDQDYPEDLLDMIVVSDESSDRTDDVVKSFGRRVRLVRQEPRAGKTSALNLAVPMTDSDILVFADANSLYEREAIKKLVANFADPRVGYVTGKMIYVNADGSLVGDGCTAYMKFENWLRAQESSLGSVIGVDGGIDAVRRSLYSPMRADQLPDFVLPLSVLEQKYRVVYERDAVLRETSLTDEKDEYRMRVRVSLRALWALWDMRNLMNPMKYGLVAIQLVSHKLLRYLAFAPLTIALLSSAMLSASSLVYSLAFVAQCLFYLLAGLGRQRGSKTRGRILTLAYYFTMLNTAAAHAVLRFLRGDRQVIWAPRTG